MKKLTFMMMLFFTIMINNSTNAQASKAAPSTSICKCCSKEITGDYVTHTMSCCVTAPKELMVMASTNPNFKNTKNLQSAEPKIVTIKK